MANYRTGAASLEDLVLVGKAFSDPGRVRILLALGERELCVCQIIALLGLAPSTVSKHMALLRQASLVAFRKEGRWIHFRLADQKASSLTEASLRWLHDTLRQTPEARQDRKRLREILRTDRERLCRV